MAVIAVKPARKGSKIIDETDEFQGLWINVGVFESNKDAPEGTAPKFVRLPRGVAVSDLQPRRIYDNMDPDFAASATLMNQLIQEIQKKALTLEEGEAVDINLSVQLYRRQEEAQVSETPAESADLAAALFSTG